MNVLAGSNNAYGGAAARVPGSVIVSLRRMNRVLEIDEQLACALVEPGVRFFDLHAAVRKASERLWISVPVLGWGSVVGNTAEAGWGYTPNGDHAANFCGLEVVLASGEVLRTGMGALAAGTDLAGSQARVRAVRRRSVRSVESRHHHQDGRLVDAASGGVCSASSSAPGTAANASRTTPSWASATDRRP